MLRRTATERVGARSQQRPSYASPRPVGGDRAKDENVMAADIVCTAWRRRWPRCRSRHPTWPPCCGATARSTATVPPFASATGSGPTASSSPRRSALPRCSAPGSTRAGRRTSASCSTTRPTTSSRSAARALAGAVVAGLNYTRRGEHLARDIVAHRPAARHHRAPPRRRSSTRRSRASTCPAASSSRTASPTATTRRPRGARSTQALDAAWRPIAGGHSPDRRRRPTRRRRPLGRCCSPPGRRPRPRRCAAPSAGC